MLALVPPHTRYANRHAAATAAADLMLGAIEDALARDGRAAIAAPGGSTPGPVFERLRAADLDWSRVTVTLTDERWVADNHPACNERQVRESLLQGRAAAARLVGLRTGDSDPHDAEAEVEARLAALTWPLAAVMLGMGADKHIASLFPGAARIRQGLDPARPARAMAVSEEGLKGAAPYARMTLTRRALADSRLIVLPIFGAAKSDALIDAMAEPDAAFAPVRAILTLEAPPVRVLWAP